MVMESPAMHFPESPADQDDVVYPCKGCGEILEEGKAFELAGNRWHIDCFRCNTCQTLLDSDANLLLLGDGSLICNNCTYSCNACGNKIEDLAILTGDQAFCASCFRCRNCKRKIENLRYARTSQGIFCMSCHESLMARRRKKAKGGTGTSRQQPPSNGPTPGAEKALPSLPPGAASASAFSPEIETPPSEYSEGQSARSPRQQHQLRPGRDAPARRDISPLSDEARRDGPTLPPSTYGESRPSNVSSISEETDDGAERGFLPMAFDPTPAPGPPPTGTITRKQVPTPDGPSPPVQTENRSARDYFSGRQQSTKSHREVLREADARSKSPARSVSTEREPEKRTTEAKQSPHIFFQEKGRSTKRHTSGNNTPASTAASPAIAHGLDGRIERPKPQHLDTGSYTLGPGDDFRLQEVPKNRKGSSARASPSRGVSPVEQKSGDERQLSVSRSPVSLDSPSSGVNPFDDPKRKKEGGGATAPPPPKHADRPARGDSLTAAQAKGKTSTPEPRTPTTAHTTPVAPHAQLAPASEPDRRTSTSSVPYSFVDAQSIISQEAPRGKITDSPKLRSSFDVPPPRNSSRPSAPSKSVANGDFIMPRHAPPPPPQEQRHRATGSVGTSQSTDTRSDGQMSPAIRSPGLPKASRESGFSMEEEMARILRGDKQETRDDAAVAPSVLRRVSNAVKHGRSFSDRGINPSVTSQSPPSSTGPIQISSPIALGDSHISSPTAREPLEQLRTQNRRQAQRIAELEAEKTAMDERLKNSAEISAAHTELQQKRNTIVVLDAQREMVVAELESMTAHLQRAKESNKPLDLQSLKSDIMRDFAESLQRLKEQMSGQIEDLMHKRTELTDEIGTLIQMKDKGFQEYEALSSRNTQLLEMNNQLVQNIQETYKSNRGVQNGAPANGLGIYHPGAKVDGSGASADMRSLSNADLMPNFDTDLEPATVLTAPQVVNIRKGGQAKKFNWRKGGEKMAKNVTKGIKGAFVGESSSNSGGVRGKEIGAPYGAEIGGVPYGQHTSGSSGQAVGGSEQGSIKSQQMGGSSAGFGFFQKNSGLKGPGAGLAGLKNNSSTNLAAPPADPSVLFGSDLSDRCEYEKRVIPAVVSHCIDEVESRGMDVEGIYRKSGGAGQVKTVQQGFEKDSNYDITDPDLDIHAITSALKQYFRRLPVPLITYEVYQPLLEAGQELDKATQAQLLRQAVEGLPEAHRNCLEYLVQHLARVMSHGGENLMTPLNLAVVFAPTIMRPFSIEKEMTDMGLQRVAVQALLEQCEVVFEGE